MAIDSKFVRDVFLKSIKIPTFSSEEKGSGRDETQKKEAIRKKLSQHLLKHAHGVSKYTVPGDTADCALLFIPSEAIFAKIVENHQHVFGDANGERVWIVSSSTLIPVLTATKGTVRGVEVTQRSNDIEAEVYTILRDINRLVAGSQKLEKDTNNLRESLRQTGIAFKKIKRRTIKLNILNDDRPLVAESAKKKNAAENDPMEGNELSPESK